MFKVAGDILILLENRQSPVEQSLVAVGYLIGCGYLITGKYEESGNYLQSFTVVSNGFLTCFAYTN